MGIFNICFAYHIEQQQVKSQKTDMNIFEKCWEPQKSVVDDSTNEVHKEFYG